MDGGFSRRFFFKTFFLVHNHPPSILTPLRLRRCFAGLFLRRGFRPPTTVVYLSIIILRPFSLPCDFVAASPVHSYGGYAWGGVLDFIGWAEIGDITTNDSHYGLIVWFIQIMDSFVSEILNHSFERFRFIRFRDS